MKVRSLEWDWVSLHLDHLAQETSAPICGREELVVVRTLEPFPAARIEEPLAEDASGVLDLREIEIPLAAVAVLMDAFEYLAVVGVAHYQEKKPVIEGVAEEVLVTLPVVAV